MPRIDRTADLLHPIEGTVPSPRDLPAGCAFAPRCGFADDACRAARPDLNALGERRHIACFHPRVSA
ncbi:MAG: oligopeptide/dipeptide ABC transporter ATP-binding protein [Burkholderiales bacterium]